MKKKRNKREPTEENKNEKRNNKKVKLKLEDGK